MTAGNAFIICVLATWLDLTLAFVASATIKAPIGADIRDIFLVSGLCFATAAVFNFMFMTGDQDV